MKYQILDLPEHRSFKGIFRLLAQDIKRRMSFDDRENNLTQRVVCCLLPGVQAIFFHRIAHYLFMNGIRIPARLVYLFNVAWTGADISCSARIEAGFVLLHPQAVIICGYLGKNATLTMFNGLGGNGSITDIGAGPGLPLVEEECFFKPGAAAWGPCHTGKSSIVDAGVIWRKDAPDGSIISGSPVAKARPRTADSLRS